MELRLYFRMLQRNWWMVIVAALVALNVALAVIYFTKPMYRASSSYAVSPNVALGETNRDVVNSLEALDRRSIVSTYAEFFNSRSLYLETVEALGLNPDTLLDYELNTVVLPESNVLELTVQGPNPEFTALLSNSIGQRAVAELEGLYQVYDISLIDPAEVPEIPFTPQPLRDAALATVLGAFVGVGLSILVEQVRMPIDARRRRRSTDPASGALAREYFEAEIQKEAGRIDNEGGELSLGLVRLNGLDGLLEGMPQPILSNVMNHVTSHLRNELRGSDAIGRWDDLTFAVMMKSASERAGERIMYRIWEALLDPAVIPATGEEIDLRPEVGNASYTQGEALPDFVRRVQRSMGTPGKAPRRLGTGPLSTSGEAAG